MHSRKRVHTHLASVMNKRAPTIGSTQCYELSMTNSIVHMRKLKQKIFFEVTQLANGRIGLILKCVQLLVELETN